MSNATAGPGFLLQKGDGASPENFTTVAEVKDLNGPQDKTDTHDVTNQSSPNNTEEIIPGLIRPGTVAFDVNHLPDDPTQDAVTGLKADKDGRTKRNWRIVLPGTSKKWTFAGYITGLSWKGPVNGVSTYSCEIRLTGKATLA
jgi:hypothetical protein